jgi:hypothetical protein
MPGPVNGPRLMTEELVAELELHLRNGNDASIVCDYVGLDVWLFRHWMKEGAKERRRLAFAQKKLREVQSSLENRQRVTQKMRRLEAKLPELVRECEPQPLKVPYLNFHERMKRAMSQSHLGALGLINRAAMGVPASEEVIVQPDGTQITRRTEAIKPQWQAAAWRLERMMPNLYGRRSPTQIQVTQGGQDSSGKPTEVPVSAPDQLGAEVVFYMPHNGRDPLPEGATVETRAEHRERKRPAGVPNPEPEDSEGDDDSDG